VRNTVSDLPQMMDGRMKLGVDQADKKGNIGFRRKAGERARVIKHCLTPLLTHLIRCKSLE
jgi:hypothetical protein